MSILAIKVIKFKKKQADKRTYLPGPKNEGKLKTNWSNQI